MNSQVVNKNTNEVEGRKYDLFMIITMIIGIVIGSGIFTKNQAIVGDPGSTSTIIAMSGWFFMSVLVFMMGVAFIEISSSTKKSNETGSLSTWTSKFLGKKMGRGVALFYITIFFPLTLAALSLFAASTFMDALGASTSLQDEPLLWFLFETLIALMILGGVIMVNYFNNRPGKIVQKSGTIFKLIPLILLVFVVFLFSIAPTLQPEPPAQDYSWGGVFDASDPIKNSYHSSEEASTGESFKRFILILPAIMFSFDGFVHAANLQNEAKSKNSFVMALVIALLVIIGVYLLFSFSTFAAGYDNFSITEVFLVLFPNQEWISAIVTFIIFISIFTAISGLFIASSRSLSSASETNAISDTKGEYLSRSKSGIVKKSASSIFVFALIWFVIIRVLDLAFLGYYWGTDSASAAVGTKTSSDWMSSVIVLFAFLIYGIILLAGVRNRWTDKVDVDKSRLFMPFALISAPIILVVTLLYGVTIIDGIISNVIYLLHVLGLLIMMGVFGVFWYYNERDLKSTSNQQFNNKKKYVSAYKELLTFEEWEKKYNSKKSTSLKAKTNNKNIKKDNRTPSDKKINTQNKKDKNK